jgi:hypothetical protein
MMAAVEAVVARLGKQKGGSDRQNPSKSFKILGRG